MSVDAPLSHGQLFSWREIARYPQDWLRDANLPTAWDLRGLPLDRVTAALRLLVDRHEPLRTTYHVADGQPVQRIHPTVTLPIERVDRVVASRDVPEQAKDELSAIGFPMTGALGWRGVLVTTDGAPVFLALSFSHLILDVWSIHHLQDQFRALVADPRATARMGPSPRELARQQRTNGVWRERQESSERYWRRVLADGLMDELPTLPAGVKRNRLEATLHSRRLGGLASEAARRLGVTAPSVVTALIAAGLARYTGTGRVTLSLMASNRFAPEHQDIVSTMNQLIPVVVTVDHGSSLAEHIKRVHWAGARSYRYSCYDFDRVAAIAAEVAARDGKSPSHDCWVNHLFRCWINYVQLDRHPSDPADQAPAELLWTPLAQQYGQAFRVRVSVQGGRTSVLLLADPTVVPPDGMIGILRALAFGAQLAATNPESTLKDLWDVRSEDLAPSLFPQELPTPPNQAEE
ncbi:condensation domain-containing protein [Sphaerisporangium sp. NPDC049002]|uniref:condensation domain-containing protein n=1 Tax=Sphaerisporangium sp. NPDC049002 TaxID=3155392 RepID=UPI0033E4EC84